MILCTPSSFEEKYCQQIRDRLGEEVICASIQSLEVVELDRVEIVVTYGNYDDLITVQDLERLPNVKWIQLMSSGTEQLPLSVLNERAVLVTSARGLHAVPISEYVVGMLLYFEKKVEKFKYLQRSMAWANEELTHEMFGKTIGILGTGNIGREIARRAKAFGMVTVGLNRDGRPIDNFDSVYSSAAVNQMIPRCDYICSVLPSAPDTRNLLNARRFELMKDGVLFINVGRGDVLVENDFVNALQTRKIAAAALDVFRDEPLSYNNQLWYQENLVITPHASARTEMQLPRFLDIFLKNYALYKTGDFSAMTSVVQ